MLRAELEENIGGIRNWFREGDIFLVDRGYRDIIPFLDELNFDCKMPASMQLGERQLTTEEANKARIVTIQRWIVEARNGHIKSIFRFLDGIIPRAHVLHLRDFYLIAGAMINKYHELIFMEGKTAELAQTMKEKIDDVNILQTYIEFENLERRRAIWIRLGENQLQGFPRLDLEYLKRLTTGIYQLSLAPSYVQDKRDHDGSEIFEFDENRDDPGLLRIRIYSRFRNATKYQLWISFVQNNDEHEMDQDQEGPIAGYYCTCKSGARTLGCCAHITSILWYLGYARHQQAIKYPDRSLLNYIKDAGNRWDPNNDQLIVNIED